MGDKIPELRITIARDGKITATVVNVSGESCVGLTAFLEKIGKVEHEEHTGDFYQQDDQGVMLFN